MKHLSLVSATIVAAVAFATGPAASVGAAPMPQQSLPPSASAASDQASEPVVAAPLNEDPESVKKVQEDLEGAGATPVVREEEGIILKDYGRVDGGPRIVTSEPAPPKPGEVSPFFRVGAGWGIYVYLTPDEQLLVAAGAAGGLTAAVCAATSGLGCAAVGAGFGAAMQWLNNRGGICGGELEIHWINPMSGPTFKCM